MQRSATKLLKKWKDSENRKPLLLQGARQVGKTYLIEEFGKKGPIDWLLTSGLIIKIPIVNQTRTATERIL